MKRKSILACVVLVAATVGFVFFWPSDLVSEQTCRQIRLGTTLEEVERMMGGPGTDMKQFTQEYVAMVGLVVPGCENMVAWRGSVGVIVIGVDDKNCVSFKVFAVRQQQTVFARVRAWVGL
jgi:hypothetical protein